MNYIMKATPIKDNQAGKAHLITVNDATPDTVKQKATDALANFPFIWQDAQAVEMKVYAIETYVTVWRDDEHWVGSILTTATGAFIPGRDNVAGPFTTEEEAEAWVEAH